MFFTVMTNLITLMICMAVGFVCEKKKIFDKSASDGLANLLISVTVPCMIIVSMQRAYSQEALLEGFVMLGISFLAFFFGGLCGLLVCKALKVPKKDAGVYIFGLTLPNVMYMGFPVVIAIYGNDALFLGTMTNVAFNVIMFTVGVRLITIGYDEGERQPLWKLALNPVMLATLAGMVLFISSFRLPEPINKSLFMIGDMTTPLAMLLIGAMLARMEFRAIFAGKTIYIMVLISQLVTPLIIFSLLRSFILDETFFGVVILLNSMPVATLTAIMAEKYNGNTELASRFVFISTLASLFTIPVISLFLN